MGRRNSYRERPIENVEEMDVVVEKPTVTGIVSGCERLNVRTAPSKDSDVATIIDKDKEVTIDPDNSSTEWYAISVDGVNGFVMSKFIKSDDYMNLDGIERWKAF